MISDIDTDNRKGTCSICGPVNLNYQGYKKTWSCGEKSRQKKRSRYRETYDPAAESNRIRAPRFRYEYGDGKLVEQSVIKEARSRFEREQDGKCLICLRNDKPLHLDHCHTTGKLRGLLCVSCNTALGKLQDDVGRLSRAIEYLQR